MRQSRDTRPYVEGGVILTALQIDYVRASQDPARVFRASAQYVDALASLDRHLLAVVSLSLEPIQLLQDIEEGSIRTWLATRIRQLDDQALRSGDWKQVVASYLVNAKYAVLRFLEGRPRIAKMTDLLTLEEEVMSLAEGTEILTLPAYSPVPRQQMLDDLKRMGDAGAQLGAGDSARYLGPVGEIELNTQFRLSSGDVEELLTTEIIPARQELVLLIKRPDYLGTAQWEFRFEDHPIRAKILDQEWLERFHKRLVDVRPGDALRARVNAELLRDASGKQVAVRYLVVKVLEIIPGEPGGGQLLLPAFEDDLGDVG
jgi:hypothetical protein